MELDHTLLLERKVYKKLKIFLFYVVLNGMGFCLQAVDSTLPSATQKAIHYRDALSDMDLIVNAVIERFNVPGVAVGIIADNKVILSRGYGVRNRAEQTPVTSRTLFAVGSCTKAFTTLILGQLVEEGCISWDDPVVAHIPEFRLFDQKATYEVTIRDLAAHRTGIPRHDLIWFCSKIPRSDVVRRLQYLEPVCGLREKFHYNNLMYAVAGILIERVTGQSWEETIYERILRPLEMSYSNLSIDQMQMSGDFSLPYAEIKEKIEAVPYHNLLAVEPGGALNSNVLDMLKWVGLQLFDGKCEKKKFIKKKTLDEMHTLHMSFFYNEREEIGISQLGYGLGWFVGLYKGHDIISHGGVVNGFTSEVSFMPQKNLGIVILSNSSSDGFYAIATIRNIILDRLLEVTPMDWMAHAQKVRAQAQEALGSKKNRNMTQAPHPLDDYVGDYGHPAYGIVRVFLENGQLFASYGDLLVPLSHHQDHVFRGPMSPLLIFGMQRMVDFAFTSASNKATEVQISFDPEAKPLVFKVYSRLAQ